MILTVNITTFEQLSQGLPSVVEDLTQQLITLSIQCLHFYLPSFDLPNPGLPGGFPLDQPTSIEGLDNHTLLHRRGFSQESDHLQHQSD